jgi:hypothetical protein
VRRALPYAALIAVVVGFANFCWVWTGLIGAITVFNAVRVVRSR